jgi:hypothetical protein
MSRFFCSALDGNFFARSILEWFILKEEIPRHDVGGAEAEKTDFNCRYAPLTYAQALQARRAPSGEAMMAIDEMSESEALEYIRAELQVLQPILGELTSVFWRALVEQWEREGRPGISPVDRQYTLDELSKMATEWLQTRNTLH